MSKYYAGIGSRESTPEIMKIMTEVASILEKRGYILRSGHSTGADLAFERGVVDPRNKNIYLPFNGFNGGYDDQVGMLYIEADITDQNYCVAYDSIKHHPRGHAMKLSSKKMMIRNYFQVHGIIDEPSSEFILCWTPNGELIGGTAFAIRLARICGIPVYNLAVDFIGYCASDIVKYILTHDSKKSNDDIFRLF